MSNEINQNEKNIIIDNVKYKYSINKMENQNGINIKLSEIKQEKNITFIYQALSDKIIKDIKPLYLCESIDDMINTLKDIFNKSDIKVEKKEEKYFMIIEVNVLNKITKYEIELEKHEQKPKDKNDEILSKLKDINDKFLEIKEEMNKMKLNMNISLNKENKKK